MSDTFPAFCAPCGALFSCSARRFPFFCGDAVPAPPQGTAGPLTPSRQLPARVFVPVRDFDPLLCISPFPNESSCIRKSDTARSILSPPSPRVGSRRHSGTAASAPLTRPPPAIPAKSVHCACDTALTSVPSRQARVHACQKGSGTEADRCLWQREGGGGSGLSEAIHEPYRRSGSPENQREKPTAACGTGMERRRWRMKRHGGSGLWQVTGEPKGEDRAAKTRGRERKAQMLVFEWRLPRRLTAAKP